MKRMLEVSVVRAFALFLMLAVLAVGAAAQIETGLFTGTVTDPSGAAVAGATITIANVDTNYATTVTTNNSGSYTSQALQVGSYKITVEAAGFKTDYKSSTKLDVGTIQRADFKLTIGQRSETVEVTTEAPQVNVDDSKLSSNVSSGQIASLPMNGRNVYDLIQLAPGAINVKGVDFENGAGTVVNGLREDFNGFLINGVSNKGLSGGAVNTPMQDTVQEFQLLTLNTSAQYGNSAGSITNLVTKGGTNTFHGSAFEFLRNNALDANNYFQKSQGQKASALHFNQFGGTVGGPILKDKLFFFGSYQGDRFLTSSIPIPVIVESPEFRAAVIAAQPNSVAALLYQNFAPSNSSSQTDTLTSFIAGGASASGLGTFGDYTCPDNSNATIAARMASIIGVTAADQAHQAAINPDTGKPFCSTIAALRAGTFSRTAPFELNALDFAKSQTQGNLFNGNEASIRIDYNLGQKDRIFGQYNYLKSNDNFFEGSTPVGLRGFIAPTTFSAPNAQVTLSHIFSPTVVNEFRAGYSGNIASIATNHPGVPSIYFFDGSTGFGAYNGYPQTFHENIYTYSDMVTVTKGNHNMKIGADFRRNIENSEFNVARPSYYFFDPLFFAADSPFGMAAGVDPGLVTNTPAHLQSNVRHWRNKEFGAYFQDDWKITRRLTLNLGLRYDLFSRHTEEANLATTFIFGPGTTLTQQLANASAPIGSPTCSSAAQILKATLAGVCGPGGFAPSSTLGAGNHHNFGPRAGFAWDVFGNGKTSLRGGFGESYEGTLYNPLSNSRWNLPYYSFNGVNNFLVGDTSNVVYGPVGGGAPTFTGSAPAAQHSGTGAQATGNINGWDPTNPNQAFLTGIVLPGGIRDPYVLNEFLSLQHEIVPKTVLEIDYVGTLGRKLFRAAQINRQAGGMLPAGTCATDNFGRMDCSLKSALDPLGLPNPNFGKLRNWQNNVNSEYHSLQATLKQQLRHGVALNVSYTWSHSIDEGSTWHSGATTANGASAGEGYSTDASLLIPDRGDSIFDVRNRLVFNYVWNLPSFTGSNGFVRNVLGGFQLNGIVSYQSGAHWSPFTSSPASLSGDCSQAGIDAGRCINKGGDYNLDGTKNDRPNALSNNYTPTKAEQTLGWAKGGASQFALGGGFFSAPCVGCTSNLSRNTFVGPSFYGTDMSLFKTFKVTERFGAQFRAEAFNLFNHTNFKLPAGHNTISNSHFGQAAGTFNPRQMQLGLKLTF